VVAISGPIELNQPIKVDNGWVCRVDQLAEFLSRPPEKIECSPELIESLFSVFNVPRPLTLLEVSPPPREVVYVSVVNPNPASQSVVKESKSRLDLKLSGNNFQKKGHYWPGPRNTWTINKRIWMFLLVWYLGCVIVSESVHLIGVAEGHWPNQSGAADVSYLASFALCGVIALSWVKSGRIALENSVCKSSKK
jgi:hypothetical protein